MLSRMRVAPFLVLLGAVGSCECGSGFERAAILWLAVDGTAEVFVDDQQVGIVSGWDEATLLEMSLTPGVHTLDVHHLGDGEGAFAAWMHLPDGTLLSSDGTWDGAVDRGGYGAWPWIWEPREMAGTNARWLRGDGGGEAWIGVGFEVSAEIAHRWSVWPTGVQVGEAAVFEFTFVAGTGGLEEGGSHALFNTVLDGSWGRGMPYPRWSSWQTDDPGGEGYLAVASAPEGVTLSLSVVDEPGGGEPGPYATGSRMRAELAVTDGGLEAGDEVVLRWGTDDAPVVAPSQARRYTFPHEASEVPASLAYPGDTLGRSPFVDVVGRTAARTHVAARRSSAVAVGETTSFLLVAVDELGNRVDGYEGTVVAATGGWLSDTTETLDIGPDDGGSVALDVTWAYPGMHHLIVSSEPRGDSGWVQVSEEPPPYRLYFGDPHSHSLASDGTWSAETAYRHADEVVGLDFAGITDHAERLTDEEWAAAVDAAAYLSRDDFVALAGYEWTGRHAEHRCVYSADGTVIPVARTAAFGNTDDPLEEVADLWDLLGDGALVVPHHPGSAVGPAHLWADHEPDLEPVVEIYSKHGSSECFGCEPALGEDWALEQGNYVRDALAEGLRFGVVGGGDGHEAPLGGMEPDHADVFGAGDHGPMARRGGLTGVWADELTRDALFDAWRARRTYATTGAQIFLQLSVNGEPMGSEITADSPPAIHVVAGGTDDLNAVVLVQYTPAGGFDEIELWTGSNALVEVDWTDEELSADAVYYVRVEQADGHRAWSSPVWVGWE
jgi:hypothetical protein